MKRHLMWLLSRVLKDISTRCCTDLHRDELTVSRRIEHEGISFLTITLPTLATFLERGLERGSVADLTLLEFQTRKTLPILFRGLFLQVFEETSGALLHEPSIEAIACIRQVCLMWKKIHLPCEDNRIADAFSSYVECDKEVLVDLPDLYYFKYVSGVLWGETLGALSEKIVSLGLVPKHGPGATAERISGNQKYALRTWHTRLEDLFPLDAYGFPMGAAGTDLYDGIDFLEPGDEPPVRVISVPKTLKTPRIIAIEPVCMQYVQQAICEGLVAALENGALTGGRINFANQGVNQFLAKWGSKTQLNATLDLSEASDRVSSRLVWEMLEAVPLVREAVFACRSTSADVPGHGVIELNKFASMGSALCFPIEAMVFYTVILAGIMKSLDAPATPSTIYKLSKDVYVYGDDIIVPIGQVQAAIESLELFGLKINYRKSFWTGKFRESCGMDAYDGARVTPTYLRRMLPDSRRDTAEIVSAISFANQLYAEGFWITARAVRELVDSLVGPLPIVQDTSPGLGWHSVVYSYSIARQCEKTHVPLVRTLVVTQSRQDDPVTGWAALQKFFLKRSESPIDDKEHLQYSVRRGSVNIKRRWVRPY